MSSPRSHRCFRGRTITFAFVIVFVVCLYFLYSSQEESIEIVKSQQSKCLSEQATLLWRLREETEVKEKLILDLNVGKKTIAELTEVHLKERVLLKDQIDKLQNELEVLKLECSKYEKQAQEEHAELEKHKITVSESQRQLRGEILTKNQVIDVLKQDKMELTEMVRRLQGKKQFPFYYPQVKESQQRFNRQVDLGDGFYIVENDDSNLPMKSAETNAQKINNNATLKSSAANSVIANNKRESNVAAENNAREEVARPVVPNGFAPELIVNDEKHKSGDYIAKPDGASDEVKKSSNNNNQKDELKPPNRYKNKFDKNDGKFDQVKLDDSMNKFPLKAPYSEDKQDLFHFGEDHNAFDNINKNHIDDNNVNDVNISLDQAEPGLHAEEDDDDYDDFEKANFPHQPGNMN